MTIKTIRLTEPQQSALECAGLECPDGPGEATLAMAWQGGPKLTFDEADRDTLVDVLIALSNAEDAVAEDRRQDSEIRKFARRASRCLATVAGLVVATGA